MDSNHRELGDFLRSRREKFHPADAPVSSGRRRRTPGLRREEVAERAGIGVDWYVRLEQGRTVNPSATTIEALVRALALDKAEAAHLRALAESRTRRAFAPESVPDAVRRTIEGLDQPAYAMGRRWDVLAWNAAASARFTDFGAVPEEDRNIVLWMLTCPAARELFGSAWADEASRIVALFRTAYDLSSTDPAFVSLHDRLRRESAEFARWWETHDVRGIAAGRKLLHHPVCGTTLYEYASFQSNDNPSLKLVIYTPVVEEAAWAAEVSAVRASRGTQP